MKFKKGIDSRRNTSGRPQGAKNKSTDQLRKLLQDFLESKLPELETIWSGLEDKEKLNYIDKLLKHILPTPQDELMRLSNEDLDRLIARLKADQSLKIA